MSFGTFTPTSDTSIPGRVCCWSARMAATKNTLRCSSNSSRDSASLDVHFTGHITDAELTAYYEIADLFLCASAHEGFCVPIVESFYKQVPVVAYAATAVPATMDGAGVLYTTQEPLEVAALVDAVIEDTPLCDRIVGSLQSSVRTVPLSDVVLEALALHLQEFPAVDGFIFTSQMDTPVRRSKFHGPWKRATASAPDVHFHHLRHFYVSALISAGCSVKSVQKALGHASAAETLETYAHLRPDDEDRTRDAIARVFATRCATDVQRAEPGGAV